MQDKRQDKGASAAPTGLPPASQAEPVVSGGAGIPSAEWRAGLKAVFDTPNALKWMTDGIKRGEFPMDEAGNLRPWSEWLADKVEAAVRFNSASAIETREGGDVQQAPSQDESAVPKADAQTPSDISKAGGAS